MCEYVICSQHAFNGIQTKKEHVVISKHNVHDLVNNQSMYMVTEGAISIKSGGVNTYRTRCQLADIYIQRIVQTSKHASSSETIYVARVGTKIIIIMTII